MKYSITLISLLLAGLSGCTTTPSARESVQSAFETMRIEIRSEISGPENREKLLAYADELEQMTTQSAADQQTASESIARLNRDFNTTAEQFENVFTALNDQRYARRQRLAEIATDARALTTEAEWKRMNRFRKLALESALALSMNPEATP